MQMKLLTDRQPRIASTVEGAPELSGRRRFLTMGAAVAEGTVLGGRAADAADTFPSKDAPWTQMLGPGVVDRPYGKPSDLVEDVIRRNLVAALAALQQRGGARPLRRADGNDARRFAGLGALDIAERKAWTAVNFTGNTSALIKAGPISQALPSYPKVMLAAGGVVIEAGGSLLGGVGVAGARWRQGRDPRQGGTRRSAGQARILRRLRPLRCSCRRRP